MIYQGKSLRRLCITELLLCSRVLYYYCRQEVVVLPGNLILAMLKKHRAASRTVRDYENYLASHNYLVFYFAPFYYSLLSLSLLTSELFLERHENISILFADICNFTEMTTSLPVDKLVETLNDLFGKFDDAADVS